jgi:hypothetical protein
MYRQSSSTALTKLLNSRDLSVAFRFADFRFWDKTDLPTMLRNVRFRGRSRRGRDAPSCRLVTRFGH